MHINLQSKVADNTWFIHPLKFKDSCIENVHTAAFMLCESIYVLEEIKLD